MYEPHAITSRSSWSFPFTGSRTSSFRFGLSLQADLAAAPHSFQPSAALSLGQALRAAAIAGARAEPGGDGSAGGVSPTGAWMPCPVSCRRLRWAWGCCLDGGSARWPSLLTVLDGPKLLLLPPGFPLGKSTFPGKAGQIPFPWDR